MANAVALVEKWNADLERRKDANYGHADRARLPQFHRTSSLRSSQKNRVRARYGFVQDSSRAESGYLRFHHPTQSLKALVLQFAVEQHRRKPEQRT